MSFPNIPNVTPTISIGREEVINLLLASIAFEELGLAHIINAEGEKIQLAVGTLTGNPLATTLAELTAVNNTVNNTLKTVIKKEMLLQFKLEEIISILPCAISVLRAERLPIIPPVLGIERLRFFGVAQGTNEVKVEIIAPGGGVVASTTAVVSNNQFEATLDLPVVPGLIIRVTSVTNPACAFEAPVASIPVNP